MSAEITSHKRTMQLSAGGKKFTVVLPPAVIASGCPWFSAVSELPELVMLSSVIAPSAGSAFGRFISFGRMCRYPTAPVVTSTECLCRPRSLFLQECHSAINICKVYTSYRVSYVTRLRDLWNFKTDNIVIPRWKSHTLWCFV